MINKWRNDFIQGFLGGMIGWAVGNALGQLIGLAEHEYKSDPYDQYPDEQWWWQPLSKGFDIVWAGFIGGITGMFNTRIGVPGSEFVSWKDYYKIGVLTSRWNGAVSDIKGWIATQRPTDQALDSYIDLAANLAITFASSPISGAVNVLTERLENLGAGTSFWRSAANLFAFGLIDGLSSVPTNWLKQKASGQQ